MRNTNSSKASAHDIEQMRVFCFPEMLEVFERIPDQSFVKGAEIHRGKTERVAAHEMVKVPVDELPIEAVVVGYKSGSFSLTHVG